MEKHVLITNENGVGIITLNRPEAINALTPEMILSIREALSAWADDANIRLVLIEGNGEKGFCAGGDVRRIRESILAGETDEALAFFDLEYGMNEMIATYEKPIVALTQGIVMGGGLGLAGHAKYRICTESTRFAMPEAAIGFFCDVGMRSVLAKAQRHRALMFMLAGTLVGAVDGIVLGLADTMILQNGFSPMRADLIKAGRARDVEGELNSLCASYGVGYGFANFCNLADKFKSVFDCGTIEEVYANLEREVSTGSELAEITDIILARCPTSNAVHLMGLDVARADADISRVLAADLHLAYVLARRQDFVEGVRAVLVDKDNSPVWNPTDIGHVEQGEIVQALV